MKILILAENPQKISQILRQDTNIKVIDEYEISEATPYTAGLHQPGYSEYITKRTANLSKVYKANKILCLVINQDHKNAVNLIEHDFSIRVYHSATPKRLRNSFTQSVNKTYFENDFNLNTFKNDTNITSIS